MANEQELSSSIVRPYKFKIEQTSKDSRVTVHGDTLETTVHDYSFLRKRLQEEGFRIAPED